MSEYVEPVVERVDVRHGQNNHNENSNHNNYNEHNPNGNNKGTIFVTLVGIAIFIVIMALWVAIWLATPHDNVITDGTYPYITLIRTVLP